MWSEHSLLKLVSRFICNGHDVVIRQISWGVSGDKLIIMSQLMIRCLPKTEAKVIIKWAQMQNATLQTGSVKMVRFDE